MLRVWRELRLEPSHGVKTESCPEETRGAARALSAQGDSSWCFRTPQVEIKGLHADSQLTSQGLVPPLLHQQGSCSKGHWHTGGLLTCLSTKRPCFINKLKLEKNPKPTPQTQGGMFQYVQRSLSMVHIYWQTTVSSLRSIWCAMEKAEQLVFHQPFKSWCMKKNKIIKIIHCFPTSVQH